MGAAHVEGVAAAARVQVPALFVQSVPARVVQPAPRQGRPQRVALGGVVVDHVEDHLDAVAMQRVHHGAELVADRLVVPFRCAGSSRCITRVRDEVGQRVVAPVVGHSPLNQVMLVDVQLHRQQANSGQSHAFVVRQHRRAGQARVGSPLRRRHIRVHRGQGFDMGFVEHRAGHRRFRSGHDRRAQSQFFGDVHDTAARHALGVVMGAGLVRGTGSVADLVGESSQGAGQGACPGIDQ